MELLNRRELIAKVVGILLPVVVAISLFLFKNGRYFPGILLLVVWCLVMGLWALLTGCLFFPGSRKAPRAFVYGKTAKILGLILLIIPTYFLFLLLTQGYSQAMLE